MISIAMFVPNLVHLYVNVSRVDLDVDLNAQNFEETQSV